MSRHWYHGEGRWYDPPRVSRPALPPLLLVGLLLVVTGASPYFGRFMNANERPRLLQGIAWVSGTSAIDGPATRHIAPGIDVSRAPDGALVPNKPPGTTAVAAVAYGVVRATGNTSLEGYTRVARMLGGWIPMALLLVLARRRMGGAAGSFALVALALGTPCLAYARLLYGHVLAAACLFAGVSVLDRARVDRRPWLGALGGAVAGAAVTVEYLAAFAGLPIGIWLLLDARRRGSWALVFAALAGAMVPIVALMAYHDALFGSPWRTPYHFVVREGFAEIHGRGLLGLTAPTAHSVFEHLLSPWGGLLYWAPLSVPATWAMVAAARRNEADTFERVSLSIFLLLLVLNLCLAQTGGWRVGPRYLVLGLPFLLPGLQRLHAWLGRPALGALVVALLGWSLFVNYLAAGLFPHLVPEGNPLRDLLLPLLAEGLRPYSMWGPWGMGLSGVGTLILFVVVTRPQTAAEQRSWLVGALGVGILLWGALLLPGTPGAEETFAGVQSIWEPGGMREPIVVSLQP